MFDIGYYVKFDGKKEYEEIVTPADAINFSFRCCNRCFKIRISEYEIGTYKASCEICGKEAIVDIVHVINYDDPDVHFYDYLKEQLEKDD